MMADVDSEDTDDDDDLPESPLHIHKAQSYDYQPSVDLDHRNTREETNSKTGSTSGINAAGPSSSKGDESYK